MEFFPIKKALAPKIYAYSDSHPQYKGLLKIGFTTVGVEERVKQQYPIVTPGSPTYTILLDEPAIRNDGTSFNDRDVHRYLKRKSFLNPQGEWFKCNVNDLKAAL